MLTLSKICQTERVPVHGFCYGFILVFNETERVPVHEFLR